MLSLALVLVLDCKPVEFKPWSLDGNSKRGLRLNIGEQRMTLVKDKAELWHTEPGGWFKGMFAADDSFVALRGPYGVGSFFIASTQAESKGVVIDPMEHLTPAEKALVPNTSCGVTWFQDWKSGKRGLELSISQAEKPPVKLYVSPAGAVTR